MLRHPLVPMTERWAIYSDDGRKYLIRSIAAATFALGVEFLNVFGIALFPNWTSLPKQNLWERARVNSTLKKQKSESMTLIEKIKAEPTSRHVRPPFLKTEQKNFR
jgi:hypothetical protein